MKRSLILSAKILFLSIFIFTACSKNEDIKDDTDKLEIEYPQEADILLKGSGDYEKVITKDLVKLDDCKFIVEGTIEFRLNGVTKATIDFGDGICDNIASKTIDGKTTKFSLEKKKNSDKKTDYSKVIVEPLVKTDNCDYIVSGIIKYYKGKVWVATVDYGDGTCDNLATKYWDKGSKVFSLKKK